MFVFTLLWNIGVVLKRDSTVTKCQFNAKKYSTTAFVLLDANLPRSQFSFEWNPRRLSLLLSPPTHKHYRGMRLKCMLVNIFTKVFEFLRTFISQTPRNWLKQDVEGVKSSSFDFFRTISRKTTQQHKRRSIWIMPPCPSAEKHKMFIHAIQTSQIIDVLQDHFPNVVSRKKNCCSLLSTSQDRIWIMLRQILWKSVTGKQRNGEMFWKTVTNDQCFFGNNKTASWSKGFLKVFWAI